MTETTTILCVSASDADKVIAEKCAYFLNNNTTFCHCVCPAEVEFNKKSTDVTIKSDTFLSDEAYALVPNPPQTQATLQLVARAFLVGYKAS